MRPKSWGLCRRKKNTPPGTRASSISHQIRWQARIWDSESACGASRATKRRGHQRRVNARSTMEFTIQERSTADARARGRITAARRSQVGAAASKASAPVPCNDCKQARRSCGYIPPLAFEPSLRNVSAGARHALLYHSGQHSSLRMIVYAVGQRRTLLISGLASPRVRGRRRSNPSFVPNRAWQPAPSRM